MNPFIRTVKPLKWRRERKPLSEEVRTTYRTLTVTLTILGLVTMMSYLYMNSLKPAKGYELKQMQIDYEMLQSELRDLERQVVVAQSFLTIEGNELLESMEPTETNQFSFVDDSPIARYSE